MKELLEKLTSYNIFNYLLPGVLFAVIGSQLTSYPLLLDNLVIGLFVYYFFGLIISRVGSLILEPLLKRLKVIRFSPYDDFLSASKIDPKIELLSEQNNMFRTLLSLLVCLLLLLAFNFIDEKYSSFSKYSSILVIILIILLLIFSYQKQTNFISSRIRKAIQTEKKNETKTDPEKDVH